MLLRLSLAFAALLIGGCAATSPSDPASRLVGKWQSHNSAQAAEYVFAADGTFTGSVAANGRKISDFAGKWALKGGAILYEYTSDKLGSIPAGTRDQDKLLSVAPDQYIIEAADGSRRKYVRIRA